MKRFFLITISILFISISLFAQKKKRGETLIDDFEQKTLKAKTTGIWSAYTDSSNEGKSKLYPRDLKQAYIYDEQLKSQVFKFDFKLDKGDFKWSPYVTLNLPLAVDQLPIGGWQAIAYEFKGYGHNMVVQTSAVKDYANFQRFIPSSNEWKTIIIPFDELKQPSWGRKVDFTTGEMHTLVWQVMGKTGDSGQVFIDNVRILRKKPVEQQIVEEEIKIKETPKGFVPNNFKIADWFDFNKAAYSLSFDDGLYSQAKYAAPILEKHQLKGTFYLVSDVLENDTTKAHTWRYGYWNQYQKVAIKGHEIGSHTASHPSLTTLPYGSPNENGTVEYELAEPLKVIKSKIPEAELISFAYPYVAFDDKIKAKTAQYYVSARGLGAGTNSTKPDFMNLEGHIITYLTPRTLESDNQKIVELENKIQNTTIAQSAWSVYLAHDVLPFSEVNNATDAYHPVSSESFDNFCTWLNQKQKAKELWVATVGEVSKYAKEREAVQITKLDSTSNQITYSIIDNLPDNIYNQALSFEVKLPENWNLVSLNYGDLQQELKVGNGVIRFSIVPDKGKIIINKMK